MFTVQIPTVYDSNFTNLIEYMEANNILMEVVKWNGPSGGWPEIIYKHEDKQVLIDFIDSNFDEGGIPDEDYINPFVEDIIEVKSMNSSTF